MNDHKPDLWTPALIGGAFLGATSALPILEYLNCACCSLVIGGGVLACYLYLRDYPSHLPVAYGDGATVGLAAGAVGWAVYAVITIPLQFIKARLGIASPELEQLEEALNDPNIPEGARQLFLRMFKGGQFSLGMLAFDLAGFLVMALVFATIGGILGVALFQKKRSPLSGLRN